MKQMTQKEQAKTKQSKWPLIITGLILAALVASYFIFPAFQENMKEGWDVLTSGEEKKISSWVEQFGFWGPFIIILAMVAQMFLVVVNVVALMLVAIIAYGPVWGSVIAVSAVAIASTVGYMIGRALGQAGVRKIIGEKAENKVCEFVSDYGLWAVIVARISPFISNDAISFVAGMTKMNYIKFMSATMAGILPLTLLLAWLGESNDRLINGLIWVGGVSLVLFVAYIVYDKHYKKKKAIN